MHATTHADPSRKTKLMVQLINQAAQGFEKKIEVPPFPSVLSLLPAPIPLH